VVDVLDAVSGSNLDHRSLPSVNEGLYAIYNVRHQVLLQVTPPSSYTNAEIYGIFVDPAIVAPLQLQPPPGAFPGRVQVSLSTITPNADIRYTTDGTDPGPNSMRYTGPLSLRSSTHLKARAFRDGFAPSPLVEGQYDNTLLNIASVTGTDTATSGNWPFKYGQEGHWLAMSDPSFPAVFEASLEGASLWTWSDQANDERALIASAGGDLRQARAWYSSDPMTLNLGVYDTQMHAVSLYFLDYDNSSRVEQVELLDAVGISLGKVNIDNFSNGEYLNLVVQGAVQVRITPLHGPNAVLSGVFVDPAPAALSLLKPAPLTDTVLNDQQLQFNTPAFPGLRLYIDRSSNLVDWQCIATNSVPGTSAALKFNVDFSQPKYFFRTHLAP
jgi:hypothetical protein